MGKILWYSFNNIYVPPRAYYFVAPKEVSTSLALLLANSDRLKAGLKHAWNKGVQDKIASKPIPLEGTFQTYVENFDFSIFHSQSLRELVDEHRHTPYFVPRFGGGLPARPRPARPPAAITERESVYVGRLLEAYADHTKAPISAITDLRPWTTLEDHFRRSREAFYHAESLRVFVRDKVEPGTFESLQDEIYDGVVDTRNATHSDGYECVVEVTKVAQSMSLDAHPLVASVFPTDRRGICHQLANEERLKWIK